jgi:hypothetical protein
MPDDAPVITITCSFNGLIICDFLSEVLSATREQVLYQHFTYA